jgi:hypothetical protein
VPVSALLDCLTIPVLVASMKSNRYYKEDIGDSWSDHPYPPKIYEWDASEAQWLRRAVVASYLNRCRGSDFWRNVFANASCNMEGLLPFVACAMFVEESHAEAMEGVLGRAVLATPGVSSLQDRSRWSDHSGHFWHFASSTALGPVGPFSI